MVVAYLALFGKFELRLADGRLLDLPGQKDRAVLAILSLSRGATLSGDKLTGLLRGDRGDAQARDSLKHALKHVRQVLGDIMSGETRECLIIADRNEIRLAPDCMEVDVIAFEHRSGKERPKPWSKRAVSMRATCWMGSPCEMPGSKLGYWRSANGSVVCRNRRCQSYYHRRWIRRSGNAQPGRCSTWIRRAATASESWLSIAELPSRRLPTSSVPQPYQPSAPWSDWLSLYMCRCRASLALL